MQVAACEARCCPAQLKTYTGVSELRGTLFQYHMTKESYYLGAGCILRFPNIVNSHTGLGHGLLEPLGMALSLTGLSKPSNLTRRAAQDQHLI